VTLASSRRCLPRQAAYARDEMSQPAGRRS
jgi:hypothetical protein